MHIIISLKSFRSRTSTEFVNDLPYYWVNSAQYGVQLFEIRENYNYFENIFIKALIYC